MSLAAVLFVIFLVLKLVGVIAWSWLWVTAPLWIGFVVWLVLAVLWGSIVGIFGIASTRKSRRRIR